MRYPVLALIFLVCVSFPTHAQNKEYAKEVLNFLCSDSLAGRGYVRNGMGNAALYLRSEFKKVGLIPVKGYDSYFHNYTHAAVSYPRKVFLAVDDIPLTPGVDFLVNPSSEGNKGKAKVLLVNKHNFESMSVNKVKKKALLVDYRGIVNKDSLHRFKSKTWSFAPYISIWMDIEKKLTWSASQKYNVVFPMFEIEQSHFDKVKGAKKIQWEVNSELNTNFKAQNVLGMVEGQIRDTFVLVTAHYDHIGMMGSETYFKGASDNASGTSLMLDLAAHISKEKPKYTTVFVAFGSEEIGLLGSKSFVDNNVVPLKQIKAVLNLDLMGGGSEGITVVNATEYPDLFKKVVEANKEVGLKAVKERGPASNSDHYWFGKKGVPAIFIYTNGDVTAYHDIYDTPEGLSWKHYDPLFKLIRGFLASL